MAKHYFLSSGDAYDATQCDDAIKDGDTLIIVSEGVVGVATTWPIAVSAVRGALHGIRPGMTDAEWAAAAGIPLAAVAAARACLAEVQDRIRRHDDPAKRTDEWFHTEAAGA